MLSNSSYVIILVAMDLNSKEIISESLLERRIPNLRAKILTDSSIMTMRTWRWRVH